MIPPDPGEIERGRGGDPRCFAEIERPRGVVPPRAHGSNIGGRWHPPKSSFSSGRRRGVPLGTARNERAKGGVPPGTARNERGRGEYPPLGSSIPRDGSGSAAFGGVPVQDVFYASRCSLRMSSSLAATSARSIHVSICGMSLQAKMCSRTSSGMENPRLRRTMSSAFASPSALAASLSCSWVGSGSCPRAGDAGPRGPPVRGAQRNLVSVRSGRLLP